MEPRESVGFLSFSGETTRSPDTDGHSLVVNTQTTSSRFTSVENEDHRYIPCRGEKPATRGNTLIPTANTFGRRRRGE